MSKTILLIEDDPFLIDIYKKKFSQAGLEIKVAESGKIAFNLLKQGLRPDLILLDIVLPQMAGWEILSQLKEDKALANLKVVILSNLGQKDEVAKGLALGAVKYLIKAQYTPSEVISEVNKLLTE